MDCFCLLPLFQLTGDPTWGCYVDWFRAEVPTCNSVNNSGARAGTLYTAIDLPFIWLLWILGAHYTVPLQPPTNVLLANATSRQLTFTWNPVISSCPATKYNIIATNCGICPSSSRLASIICLNPQPQPNAGVTCTFSVRTETCEGVLSESSDVVTAILKGTQLATCIAFILI